MNRYGGHFLFLHTCLRNFYRELTHSNLLRIATRSLVHHSMKTIKKNTALLMLVALSATILGCTPKWEGVFLNIGKQDFEIEIIPSDEQTPPRRFKLARDAAHKSDILIGRIVVKDDSGVLLKEHKLSVKFADKKYIRSNERQVRLLVSKDSIYLVPVKYWNSWSEHTSEIFANDKLE